MDCKKLLHTRGGYDCAHVIVDSYSWYVWAREIKKDAYFRSTRFIRINLLYAEAGGDDPNSPFRPWRGLK
jgi:hypothetical protein